MHGRFFSAEQVTLGGVPPLMSKHERFVIARAIARAFLSVWPDRARMLERAGVALGYPWTFLAELTDRVLAKHGVLRRPPSRALLLTIAFDPALLEFPGTETDREALALGWRLQAASLLFLVEPRMEAPVGWSLPSVVDEHGLCALLGLNARELEQLAGHGRSDRRASSGSEALRNYTYTWRGKRLIEAPKRILKRTQRKIASLILDKIPVHEAAHGFRRGRSIVTHALVHAGCALVIRLDLSNFFPSITGGRVVALFRTAGYPEHIARVLGILSTNITPAFVLREVEGSRFRVRHLPQGAPSSPMIANLCAHALDRRLAGLARRFGLSYTRYADDLVFSGSLGASLDRFLAIAAMIVSDEGFRINHRKTRVMRAGGRQKVTGVVVNQRPNIERREYEQLKAILRNAARFGLESQNREQHPDFAAFLRGKVSYVTMISPARGAKLRAILDRI